LHPSEKELLEWHSGVFRHKIPLNTLKHNFTLVPNENDIPI
jgi:hypothetical protein